MHRKMSFIGALAMIAVGLMAIAGVSYAQYPSPTGGITLTSQQTTVSTGGQTTLTCMPTDEKGKGIPNVPCTLTITSEPGTDAGLDSKTVTKITNSQGFMTDTLNVGSTPGLIVIEASSNGFSSSILVTVTGESSSPPQSPINDIQPPTTGDGGLLGSN